MQTPGLATLTRTLYGICQVDNTDISVTWVHTQTLLLNASYMLCYSSPIHHHIIQISTLPAYQYSTTLTMYNTGCYLAHPQKMYNTGCDQVHPNGMYNTGCDKVHQIESTTLDVIRFTQIECTTLDVIRSTQIECITLDVIRSTQIECITLDVIRSTKIQHWMWSGPPK